MRDLIAESIHLCDGPVVCGTCEVCSSEHLAPHPNELPPTCTFCDGPLRPARNVTPSQAHLKALWSAIKDRDAAIQSLLKRPI